MDPFGNYNFLAEFDGIGVAAFQEVSGLDSTVETVEYREGNDPMHARKLPGRTSYSNITLRRGVTDNTDLFEWHKQVIDGVPTNIRRSGAIVLLDRQRQEVARWTFHGAWPTKYTAPSFNATDNQIAIEAFELAVEELFLEV
jgi:phage tail-like protein